MTDIDKAYGEMQRLAVLLLSKLGGDITITERELAEVDLERKALRISNPDPARGDVRVRIVDEGPWPDVWSEYRRVFERLGMDEVEARELITSALQVASRLGVVADAGAIADALKGFVVRRDERDPAGADMRARLASALLWLGSITDADEKPAAAMHLFGTRGETLHLVLAEMRIDVPQLRDIVMSKSLGLQGMVHRVEGDRVQVWWSDDDASWESPASLTVISKASDTPG